MHADDHDINAEGLVFSMIAGTCHDSFHHEIFPLQL